ncbi:MAG: exosortase N [Saprospiraceae bacterium]|nr:exosortase N [Saprospiraceae bacterium]
MKHKEKIQFAILVASYAGLLVCFKWSYLPKSLLALTGLAALPFMAWRVSEAGQFRYAWAGLILAALSVIYPSQMLFWFACGFAAMAAAEGFWGRMNYLPAYLMVVISPVFRYISDVWSFPIRLKMSELAAKSLTWIGLDAKASGNVIVLDGVDFHVDTACMGLHSLSSALLLTLLLLAYFERRNGRYLAFLEVGLWQGLALCLAIAANFMRMLALVIFKVSATDPMHDGWGLFAIGTYVLVPLFFLLKWRFAKTFHRPQFAQIPLLPVWKKWLPHALILPLLLLAALLFKQQAATISDFAPQLQIAGFQRTLQKDGVLKFENDSLLIYMKPPVNWLNASHDPRICWQGSGYEFKHIKKEKIAGIEAYTAILENGTDKLYTAWWYTDGNSTALDEWTWRWSGVFGKGKGFWLVNVTIAESHGLAEKIAILNQLNLVRIN